jgi:hypothetical protein
MQLRASPKQRVSREKFRARKKLRTNGMVTNNAQGEDKQVKVLVDDEI